MNPKFINSTIFTLILFFFHSSISYSQQRGDLERKIDSLNQSLKNITGKIDSLNELRELTKKDITRFSTSLESLKVGENPDLKIEVKAGLASKIRSEPSSRGAILKDLGIGEKFYITNFYENDYLGAYSDGISGYVSKNSIEMNEQIYSLIRYYDLEKDKANNLKILEIEKENPRLANLIRRFGEENANKILKKDYWIGMTRDMARESLGRPREINSTDGSWGSHEQWVYRNGLYLYFENGILTAFQR